MAFCTKCGAELENNTKFCTACGAPVEDAPATATTAAPAAQQPTATRVIGFYVNGESSVKKLWKTEKVGDALKGIVDTTDTTAEHDAEDAKKNKVMAILSYIWILFLVPMFAAKDSKFASFHANQGLTLCVFSIAYSIVSAILTVLFGLIPVVGIFLNTIVWLIGLLFIGAMVIGIYNAATGKARELPFIGHITFLK